MKKFVFVLSLAIIFGFSLLAEATLYERGDHFVYDSDQDITWLRDAGMGGINDWWGARDWALALDYEGYDDWQLPEIDELDHLYNDGETGFTPGDFVGLQPHQYWSGTEYAPGSDVAWYFVFVSGHQYVVSKGTDLYAWAVRPGDVDVAPVPEPGTMLLMVLGLLGVVGMSRFGKRHG